MPERDASGAKDRRAFENNSQQAPLDTKVVLRLWGGIFNAWVFVPPKMLRTGSRIISIVPRRETQLKKKAGIQRKREEVSSRKPRAGITRDRRQFALRNTRPFYYGEKSTSTWSQMRRLRQTPLCLQKPHVLRLNQ
jgi:hypothetical protein